MVWMSLEEGIADVRVGRQLRVEEEGGGFTDRVTNCVMPVGEGEEETKGRRRGWRQTIGCVHSSLQ